MEAFWSLVSGFGEDFASCVGSPLGTAPVVGLPLGVVVGPLSGTVVVLVLPLEVVVGPLPVAVVVLVLPLEAVVGLLSVAVVVLPSWVVVAPACLADGAPSCGKITCAVLLSGAGGGCGGCGI